MKAVLVIDMPTKCKDCPHSYDGIFCLNVYEPNEAVEGGMMWKETEPQSKPSWCPLRPLPKTITDYDVKIAFDYDPDYALGWNSCLKEITGGKEK